MSGNPPLQPRTLRSSLRPHPKHDINETNVLFLVCGKFENRRRGESFRQVSKGKRLIEIKHSILARTSFNHSLTTSNFYYLPGNQTNSATVWYLRYQLKRGNLKVVNINWLLLFLRGYVSGQRTFCLFQFFFYCSPMKIRPGQADRKEKASSVYRLRQSTKDESMKRFLPVSHF